MGSWLSTTAVDNSSSVFLRRFSARAVLFMTAGIFTDLQLSKKSPLEVCMRFGATQQCMDVAAACKQTQALD